MVEPTADSRVSDDATLPGTLETHADTIGDEPFVHYGPDDVTVSFAEVDRMANVVGRSLQAFGLSKGDRVSVMLHDKLQTAYSYLGTLKFGGVYAPVNSEFKGDVLAYQMRDIDPHVLLLEDRYVGRVNAIADRLEELPPVFLYRTGEDADAPDDGEADDELDDAFAVHEYADLTTGSDDRLDVDLAWHDDVTILYTSGTTGYPKGVVVPHRWVHYYGKLRWEMMDGDDVLHSSLPLYHGAGLHWDFASALFAGSAIALWDRFSTSRFWDRVERYEASAVTLISVMSSWLLDQPERDDDHLNSLYKVQMAPLLDTHEAIARRFGFDLVTTKFGQTESGTPTAAIILPEIEGTSTPHDLRRGMSVEDAVARAEEVGFPVVTEAPQEHWLGEPVPWIEAAVLDERDEAVPPGELGELAFRPKIPGIVFSRYHGKPEATVEATRNLWYHAGDAVTRDDEGNYYYVDRIGSVIRRRGESISSRQVEAIVNRHGPVGETAAFPVRAENVAEDEIAIVVAPDGDGEVDEAELRTYLESRMPSFMLPQHVFFADEIPTTENHNSKFRKKELHDRFLG